MMPKNFRLVFNLSKNVIALVKKKKIKLFNKKKIIQIFLIKKIKLPPTHSKHNPPKKKIKNI